MHVFIKMQGISSVVETSSWPCAYDHAYWALQEPLEEIGTLMKTTDNATLYRVKEAVQSGETLLGMNGLVDITVDPESFEGMLVHTAKLFLNGKLVESARVGNRAHTFKTFSETRVLPMFVVKTLDIMIEHDATDARPPKYAISATGLLFTIKDKRKPFVVSMTANMAVTWDGLRAHVVEKQSSTGYECQYSDPFFFRQERVRRPQWSPDDESNNETDCVENAGPNPLLEHLARNDEDCDAEKMWQALS